MDLTLTQDEVIATIADYVRRELLGDLDGDEAAELTPSTPLLRSGILNSHTTARLLAFILEEFGISVPPADITGRNFKDLQSIAALVTALGVG